MTKSIYRTGKAYQVNITDHAQVKSSIDAQVAEFNGRLDIFIANSGIPWTQGSALTGDLSHFDAVTRTNFDGTFYCARIAGQHWARQKAEGTTLTGETLLTEGREWRGGSFVATASMSAHIVNIPQAQAVYNATKAGMLHLCKSLAVEFVRFARVNTVSPGYMATGITDFVPRETKDVWRGKIPMGREGEVGELKGAFLFLSSDASSYCTGTDLVVDGGYLLP